VTREHKLALIVGFSLFLVLGVLISDHFSKTRRMEIAENTRPASAREVGAAPPGVRLAQEPRVTSPLVQPVRSDLQALPGVHAAANQPQAEPPVIIQMDRSPQQTLALTHVRDQQGMHVEEQSPPPVAPPQPSPAQIPCQKHDIKDGDTLYRIAVKYYGSGNLWEKLRDYNKDKISGESLHEGVTLLIPPKDVLLGKPYSPPASSQEAQAPAPTDPRSGAQPPAPSNFKDYTVKDGDTIVAISRKMLGSAKRYNEIIEANQGSIPLGAHGLEGPERAAQCLHLVRRDPVRDLAPQFPQFLVVRKNPLLHVSHLVRGLVPQLAQPQQQARHDPERQDESAEFRWHEQHLTSRESATSSPR